MFSLACQRDLMAAFVLIGLYDPYTLTTAEMVSFSVPLLG